MHRRQILALGGLTLAFVLAPAGAALAHGPKVTVRVEGRTRTLLAPTVVQARGGWITKGGEPSGQCPAGSAAGALDVATHHHWSGKVFASIPGIFITSILGDTETGTSRYWEVLVDNVAASSGACEIKLHPREQLLFAVVPASGTVYPLALSAPAHATAGHAFKVKVVWFDGKGHPKPLAGAHVSGVITDSHGIAKIVAHHDGTLVLHADKHGYIRAPVRVRVSG